MRPRSTARMRSTTPRRPARRGPRGTAEAPSRAVKRKPNRTISFAARVAVTAHISTSGVTTAPAAPAVPPRAPWTKRGTNVSTPKIVVPRSTPAMNGAAVSMRRKRDGGTRGCARRFWRWTNSASEPMAAAKMAARQPKARPPSPGRCSTAKSSPAMPATSVAAPARSSGSGRATRDSTICVATSASAIRPRGMLIVKIERHPNEMVIHAPRSGPIRLATPHTPEKRPWTRARSSSE